MSSAPRPAFRIHKRGRKDDRRKWREIEMKKQRKREGGCTSTRNLIMHGGAAGAKERKRAGRRRKEERSGPTHTEGWRAGGEEG